MRNTRGSTRVGAAVAVVGAISTRAKDDGNELSFDIDANRTRDDLESAWLAEGFFSNAADGDDAADDAGIVNAGSSNFGVLGVGTTTKEIFSFGFSSSADESEEEDNRSLRPDFTVKFKSVTAI